MNKKVNIILVIVVVALFGYALWKNFSVDPKYRSTSESHFLLNEIFYDCSKAISGKWTKMESVNRPVAGEQPVIWYFQPSLQEDLEKYCRMGAVIEYKAVIDILQREDVSNVIAKYNTAEAWVRALGHKYINDKDYLKRILPKYSDIKIDCIIVVHSPEGTRFFIENGEKHESHADHQYMEVPAKEFLASLNEASDQNVTNFWLGLH